MITSMASLDSASLLFVALAAMAAGLVNAIAGGGSLISFPALTAVGLPAVIANLTNTVALLPGYGGAALAQRREPGEPWRRAWLLQPAALLGGLLGALLLLRSGEAMFMALVPWLILASTALLALQEPLRRWLLARQAGQGAQRLEAAAVAPVFLASVYGGYFGAGLGVILLAVLGLLLSGNLTRLNGLKQTLALQANLAAAALFAASGQLHWGVAAVMAVGSALGGALGGRLAGRISPSLLRGAVVMIGLAVGLVWLSRTS